MKSFKQQGRSMGRVAGWLLVLALFGGAGGCIPVARAPLSPPHGQPVPGMTPNGSPVPVESPLLTPALEPITPPGQVPGDGPPPTFEGPSDFSNPDQYSAPLPVESGKLVPQPFDLPFQFPQDAPPPANPDVEPPRLQAPMIVPQQVAVPPTLKLTVRAPARRMVDEISTLTLTLENTGDEPADNVRIESRFDAAFSFPGSNEKQVKQTIGALNAGESRAIKLSLRSRLAGRHCVTFELSADNAAPVTETACVDYVKTPVSLELHGPAKRMVGGKAEWNFAVQPLGQKAVPKVAVVLTYDSTYLKPLGGSEGAKQELGRITWPLGTLQAAERVELQVEFECLMPVDSTCLDVRVSAGDGPEQSSRSCLEIIRRIGALEIDLEDVRDPLVIGQETEYVVTIINRNLRPAHDLQITAAVPALFRVSSGEVREDATALPVETQVDGQRVRFDPVDLLAPDAKLTFRIKAKALRAGTETLWVEVTSDEGTVGTIRLEEVTTVADSP